jgi:hypothetical protein
MNLEHDDGRFEAYLRQFKPPEPRALVRPAKALSRTPMFAAAAAIILIAMACWLAVSIRQRSQVTRNSPPVSALTQPTSMAALGRLAREHPEQIDEQLDVLSSHVLPDVQRGDGVLRKLARE